MGTAKTMLKYFKNEILTKGKKMSYRKLYGSRFFFKEFTVYEKLRYNINLLENTEFNLAKNLDVCVGGRKKP